MSETRSTQARVAHAEDAAKTCTPPTHLPAAAVWALRELGYRELQDLSHLLRSDVGSYVLVVRVGGPVAPLVGSLGAVALGPGLYAYSGSALRGLRARLARHLRVEKRLHWHVDYLLAASEVTGIWVHVGMERLECTASSALLSAPGAGCPAPGFGSSDCRCRSHLIALPS